MDFVDGMNLGAANGDISKLLAGATFQECVNLITQLAMDLNLLHHYTKQGKPLVHLDLKGPNIRIQNNKNQDKRRIEGRIVDYGFARSLSDDDASMIHQLPAKGTLMFAAPEVFGGKGGIKSDVYSFFMQNPLIKITFINYSKVLTIFPKHNPH